MLNYNIKIIKREDEKFPKQLKDLKDCPKQIYAIGNLNLLNEFCISVVGARVCEEDSKKFTQEISYGLAKDNVVIVSGLAYGIDSVAHESALKANGKTIAVLGGGFDDIYPKENIKLYNEIIEKGGLVISEYEPDEPPLRHHFLERNRIVAALSNGVVLIEAKENSGSITTAYHAKRLKRNLFVLPGAASNPRYAGSNKLLTQGAKCILSYKDVLKEYKIKISKKIYEKEEKVNNEIKIEKIPNEYLEIYNLISNEAKTSNQIAIELQRPISEVNSLLTLMEMDGFAKQFPGKRFVKNSD